MTGASPLGRDGMHPAHFPSRGNMPIYHFQERVSPRRFRDVDIGFFGNTRDDARRLASLVLELPLEDLQPTRR